VHKWAFKVKRTLAKSGCFGIYISCTLEAEAHSGIVMADKWAHVSVAFFTQNSSYGNMWKVGQSYAEQSECYMVLLLTICIILGFKIMYDGHFMNTSSITS
jgi:hypothetical protein